MGIGAFLRPLPMHGDIVAGKRKKRALQSGDIMRYYLIRQAPDKNPDQVRTGVFIESEAKEWEVVMILKTIAYKVQPNILYKSVDTGIVFVHQVDKWTYDMMDALDIPKLNTRRHFRVVVPQDLYTHNTVILIRPGEPPRVKGSPLMEVHYANGSRTGQYIFKRMG